ncbi:probable phosphoglycerate mutase [Quadrisphaera granulorum]|uniref:Putative phosphoglycerate mutase n=1 Tax=Quadrisphaera granulorum TaxID=317664 RepID=A0A316AAR1_9ACTN|nr:histidine phosphatase family protein [Quadrisphaera granulorum]PWJ54711.1 putative phosphoglycerate mutase [Quadrisphaera granulorum]SZE96073.1 probable phosphoglycerate mutase [Quadrisphaera granulorum]
MTAKGRLLLLRHGATEWAVLGRHTGSTDVPLTPEGELQARAAARVLARVLGERTGGGAGGSGGAGGGVGSVEPALVVVSPRQRARRTAQLAGLGVPVASGGLGGGEPVVDQDLAEWDYGAYEGLTTPQIRALRGDDWRAFRDGMAPGGPGQPPGEQLEQVAARCARVLGRVRPELERGDVVLVAHGHVLRILATVWLGVDPTFGAQLLLDTAAVCVLGSEHEVPGLSRWNLSPGLLG